MATATTINLATCTESEAIAALGRAEITAEQLAEVLNRTRPTASEAFSGKAVALLKTGKFRIREFGTQTDVTLAQVLACAAHVDEVCERAVSRRNEKMVSVQKKSRREGAEPYYEYHIGFRK